MGAKDLLVGLTQKAIDLEKAMHAAWKEMVMQAGPKEIFFEKGALDGLRRRFDVIWKRTGLKRTILLDAILGMLMDEPKTFAEVFNLLKDDEEFEGGLDRKEFSKAAAQLMEADLITGDESKIWILG